jgi:hypothetical protein
MILEGREQARSSRLSSVQNVVTRFEQREMLPADFDLAVNEGKDVADVCYRVRARRATRPDRRPRDESPG